MASPSYTSNSKHLKVETINTVDLTPRVYFFKQ
uniref:Uncharacterized protein n=1 Tax=Anguilla anguilla TaxID=7936 RepID=A0A0E9QKJ7_ANGAN